MNNEIHFKSEWFLIYHDIATKTLNVECNISHETLYTSHWSLSDNPRLIETILRLSPTIDFISDELQQFINVMPNRNINRLENIKGAKL